ncbi:head decoration protein [Mesorhizobium sp. WSM4906]|uniref:head decoration protein n=1 Tax=Mesorhizobium sp. WSM4906 TaxID=3038546 RepID=UPI002416672B|nr:head decoration protein [Mesorhizobium sp. WSM4906]WFP74506.1 head decoration protein [Mesorhizobium sp. WSM4906]
MLDIKTIGPRNLAFVLSEQEGNGEISREVVTILSGAGKLEPGSVLGQVTASKKYILSPNAQVVGKEGAETASAILAYEVDATSADVDAVVIKRIAAVKKSMLIYDASVNDDTKKAAKLAQLVAVDIIAR